MILTEPEVRLLTTTKFDEALIDLAGTYCYDSEPGRPEQRIPKWIKNGHHSLLEHGRAILYVDYGAPQLCLANRYLRYTELERYGYIVSGNYRAWREVWQTAIALDWPDNLDAMRDIAPLLQEQAPHVFGDLPTTNEHDAFSSAHLTEPTVEEFKRQYPNEDPWPHMFVHGAASFDFTASRVWSHEFVRQRDGSPTQRSQRYVDESEPSYFLPPEILAGTKQDKQDWLNEDGEKTTLGHHAFRIAMDKAWHSYKHLLSLGYSKQIARYVLPNACLTKMVYTTNLASWHHIIGLRAAKNAQPEMQVVGKSVLRELLEVFPDLFRDLEHLLGGNW